MNTIKKTDKQNIKRVKVSASMIFLIFNSYSKLLKIIDRPKAFAILKEALNKSDNIESMGYLMNKMGEHSDGKINL